MQIGVTVHPDLATVAKAVKASLGPKPLRREMLRGLREGTKPVVLADRAAALALPGHAGTGLRASMAGAIRSSVRTGGANAGVSIRMNRGALGARAGVAKLTNSPGHWRHPVYGHGPWVEQASSAGWFDHANAAGAPAVRLALRRVLADCAAKAAKT